ncbi:MAG: histidine ammonia-lyase [Rhodospirillales bacterium]|nr:histidine ammonia-lyase [Rhodospirillales bacterium]
MFLRRRKKWLSGYLFIFACGIVPASAQVTPYEAIHPISADKTITLTGRDMTIDQLIQIARDGAKVQLTDEARRRSADAYGLLLEGATEGVAIYGFNRGSGAQRETKLFEGDPSSPANEGGQRRREEARFREEGPQDGYGPEIASEEIVRSAMAVRANAMSYDAASPELTQMLVDMLNHRVTPVVQSRGSIGEGDLEQMHNIAGAMVGEGDAYFEGVRMPALTALEKAGLRPLKIAANDDFRTLTSSDAYTTGQAALLVSDGKRALDWADLIYAMDLDGMNSSVTPLSQPARIGRPFQWLNWNAERVLDMLKGSYLFDDDPTRIIQDPESLRASSVRQGSAWQAWAALKQIVQIQMNSSDHNPVVRVGAEPKDSWELGTQQFMKYYVKGGKHSDGKHGYILSNANWDPYPLVNQVEAFSLALANMDVAVVLRIERFNNPFFTVITPKQILDRSQTEGVASFAPPANEKVAVDLWQDIQAQASPVMPEGQAIVSTVEDLQGQSRLKIARARQVVADTIDLLGQDFLTATFWMDLRQGQDPSRTFGAAPTAAWQAFRKIMAFQRSPAVRFSVPPGAIAATFLRSNSAAEFMSAAENTLPN